MVIPLPAPCSNVKSAIAGVKHRDCYIKAEVVTSKQKWLHQSRSGYCAVPSCVLLKGLQPVEVGARTNTQYSHSCSHLLSLVLPTGSNLEDVTVIFTVTVHL